MSRAVRQQLAAARRDRIVEGDRRNRRQRPRRTRRSITSTGRQQVGQRDGAEIVAERRAGAAAAACSAETPGLTVTATRAQAGIGAALQQLEHQGRQRVDAGIARADQGDAAALGGALEREAAALDLGAEREVVARLAGGGRRRSGRDRGRSRPVPRLRPSRRSRLGGAPVAGRPGRGRPPRAGPAAGRSWPGRGRPGARATAQVTRAPLRLATSSRPSAPAAARAAPSATPQQPVSRNTSSDGVREARRSPRASRSAGKNRAGTPQLGRQRMDRGLGGLEVERDDAGDGCAGSAHARRARPRPGRSALPAVRPASAPTPSARTGGW